MKLSENVSPGGQGQGIPKRTATEGPAVRCIVVSGRGPGRTVRAANPISGVTRQQRVFMVSWQPKGRGCKAL
jgi:hypothetical protein